jgi:hypothetical protein
VLLELHKKLVLHVDEEYKQVYCDLAGGELAYGSGLRCWLKAIPRKNMNNYVVRVVLP